MDVSLSGCSLEQKLLSSVTHSPDRTRPGTPFLTSAISGLRSALECRNLISSNSFAHRLGTGNFALRLAPGLVGLKPELRQGRSEFIYKIGLQGSDRSDFTLLSINCPYWHIRSFPKHQLTRNNNTCSKISQCYLCNSHTGKCH